MKINFIILIWTFFIGLPIASYAETSCVNYQRTSNCSQASESGFVYNSQSKSDLVSKGSTIRMKVVFFSGFDFSISLCVGRDLGDSVRMSLADSKTGEKLYDNETDNFATHMQFSSEVTRSVIISVSIPDKASSDHSAASDCLGVLIEQKPTAKVG